MKTADPPATAGRRERNKQRVRERIYSSAIELFTENGYDKTTIDDITERADVARGTFFNYFQRKDDVISEWLELRRRKMADRLAAPLSLDATDTATLLQLCMAVLAQVNEEEVALTVTMVTAWVKSGRPLADDQQTAEIFARIIGAGQQRGDVDPEVDPSLIGNVLHDIYLGALYRWIGRNHEPGQFSRELRVIVRTYLHGIAVAPGPQREGS